MAWSRAKILDFSLYYNYYSGTTKRKLKDKHSKKKKKKDKHSRIGSSIYKTNKEIKISPITFKNKKYSQSLSVEIFISLFPITQQFTFALEVLFLTHLG